MAATNGAGSFGTMLNTIMREHGLNQRQMAEKLGVSQPGLGRWCRGHEPNRVMRERMLAKLKALVPHPPAVPPAEKPAEPAGPIRVAVNGGGLELAMQISRPTARRVLQVLLSDNE